MPIEDAYSSGHLVLTSLGRLCVLMLRENKEVLISPMAKAPTPTEKSKKQRDNTKNATKNLDYTTIAD